VHFTDVTIRFVIGPPVFRVARGKSMHARGQDDPEPGPLVDDVDVPPAVAGWRYLEGALPGIAANLALDEALLIEADERGAGPALRIWEPDAPAVVLGASGRWRDEVRVEACQADGVAIARRSSGGGTVVIGPGTLNLTVVLPETAAPGLGAVHRAQAYVLGRIARAFRALGPDVALLGSGDLTLDRRKFSGSAQRRLRNHFLVHATILYRFSLERIGRYLHLPRRQPVYRGNRSHDAFLVNIDLPRHALIGAIRSAWLPPDQPIEPAPVPEPLVRELVRTKFADPAWIERL
jgi:lipoate-protein ligase A